VKIKVVRRDREQTGMGATQSALYAAAFALQASNTRAAMNHTIQSTGAQITKRTQVAVWNLQPIGVNDFQVMPMNIHDELQVPCNPSLQGKIREEVMKVVESFRPKIPLIKIDWSSGYNDWSEK
jgi:DNA polymerase I-like protein with 3'-5' exonuclease and polymerase domains